MKSKSEVKSILKSKFLCQDKFSNEIEQLVKENAEMNYIEAICHYCEENNIEIEKVGKLISKPLKEKLKCNATNLNYLKKTSKARLVF
jgi:tRNA G18 (ribose-2'-O)-methylase SpoU